MPKARLTELSVARMKPPLEGRLELWDTLLPAFGLRISASGRKVWIVAVRKPGSSNPSRLSIGRHPEMGLAEARTRARELLADPTGAIAERQRAKAAIMSDVLAEFIRRDQQPRRRAWRQVQQILERELAPWADRPASTITRRDVVQILNRAHDRGSPVMARRLHAHISRLFSWAVEQAILDASPAAGVRAPAGSASRERVLSPDELAAVWRGCEALGWPYGPIVRLLIVTAQRRGEVAGMRWAEIRGGIWTLPAARTKANREHVVPLSPLAAQIIAGLPRVDRQLVFTGRTGGPVANFTHARDRLERLSGVADWRLHDLRRTAASGMAQLGHPPHIVGAVLNHARGATLGAVTAAYVRTTFLAEKRAALEAWAAEVGRIVTSK